MKRYSLGIILVSLTCVMMAAGTVCAEDVLDHKELPVCDGSSDIRITDNSDIDPLLIDEIPVVEPAFYDSEEPMVIAPGPDCYLIDSESVDGTFIDASSKDLTQSVSIFGILGVIGLVGFVGIVRVWKK